MRVVSLTLATLSFPLSSRICRPPDRLGYYGHMAVVGRERDPKTYKQAKKLSSWPQWREAVGKET